MAEDDADPQEASPGPQEDETSPSTGTASTLTMTIAGKQWSISKKNVSWLCWVVVKWSSILIATTVAAGGGLETAEIIDLIGAFP